MRELGSLDGDVEEVDGRGLSAIPGLVDCHTHACFAGDRVEEFSLRAGGATYEELHARGGGILSTVRATREAGEAGLAAALAEHAGWMLRAGTTTFEAKSGYGLDRETELAQLRVVRDAGGIPTWLGAHAVPPEFAEDGADAYVDFLLADVLPDAAEIAEAADVFLERGAFDAEQARRYLTACRDAGLALRLHGDQFTESGAIPLAIELGARSVDHLEATGAGRGRGARAKRRRRRAASRERALPEPADASRARARRRRRGGRARDRLQPGQRVLREPAARLLARRDAAVARAGGGARRVHGQRRPRPRPRRPKGPARAGLRRRRRPRRGRRLAPSRVPPRRSGRAHRRSQADGSPGERRHNRRLDGDEEAAAAAREGAAPRLRLGRRRGQRGRARRHARGERREARARRASSATRRRRRGSGRSSGARSSRRSCSAPCSCSRPDLPLATKLTQTLLIVAIFVPFSYFLDRFFYRSAQRRRAARRLAAEADARRRCCASNSCRSVRWGRTATSSRSDATSGEAAVVDPSGDATELRLTLARIGTQLRRDPRHARPLGSPARRRRPRRGHRGAGVHGRGRALRCSRRPPPVTPPGVTLRPYTPDVLLDGGETIEVAGIDFEVLSVPGHSPAHLAYHADGCLFSGDVLFAGSVGRTDFPGSDWETLLASIRMLVDTLPAETVVYPGHGPIDDARRRARAQPVPRRAPRGAQRREPRAEDRASARHPRRPPRRAAALAPRHVGDRAPLRALRLPADHDARVRGHGALRADVGRRLGRRAEGDVHVRGPVGPLADAPARGRRRRSAARTSSTGCTASRSRRSSSRSRPCTATARRAGAGTASTGRPPSRRSGATIRRSTPS